MPLSKDALKSKFVQVFNDVTNGGDPGGPPPPLMPLKVAQKLAQAYHEYAGQALAGALSISVPGVPAGLAATLSGAPLMQGWGPGLVAYWTPVVWAGPGFIPANPTIPAAIAGVAPEIVVLMTPPPKVQTMEEFADKLATILHTYTTKLQVTATTAAGVASTVPVS